VNSERTFQVLRAPHFSEKASIRADRENQVVLRVSGDATKPEIKAAVEALFQVRVEQVRVLNVKGKERRTRHGVGRKSDWKKAYVRLAAGQDIDFTAID
jgi:large subunit ribosomal protein L23